MLVLAPAVLLIRREDVRRERVLMEWSGLTTAALAVSTIPASYNFVLMVFPVCVMAGYAAAAKAVWMAGGAGDCVPGDWISAAGAGERAGTRGARVGAAAMADAGGAGGDLCVAVAR